MNTYSILFFSPCPNNGVRIEYALTIQSTRTIRVEEVLSSVDAVDGMFHEEIATELQKALGGRHVMEAEHHGVRIVTERGHPNDTPADDEDVPDERHAS